MHLQVTLESQVKSEKRGNGLVSNQAEAKPGRNSSGNKKGCAWAGTQIPWQLELESIKVLRAHTISSWNEVSTPASTENTSPSWGRAPPACLPWKEADSWAVTVLTLELHLCLVFFCLATVLTPARPCLALSKLLRILQRAKYHLSGNQNIERTRWRCSKPTAAGWQGPQQKPGFPLLYCHGHSHSLQLY